MEQSAAMCPGLPHLKHRGGELWFKGVDGLLNRGDVVKVAGFFVSNLGLIGGLDGG